MEPQLDPTPAPSTAAPIKAGVSVTAIQPEKSFQSIIDQNADVWPTLQPEQKQKAADAYLEKFIHPLPGFQQLSDDQKNNFYTEFNKKYNVGQVQTEPGLLGNINTGINTAALYVGSVVDPALKAASFGLLDAPNYMANQARQGYPGIETDPGALGDAYRMHQNPYTNMVGGALGAAGSVANLAKGIGGWAIPAFSGASNAVNVAQGNATPLQGIGQTAVDSLVGLIPGGKSLLGNVAKQGAGGAIGGAASSAVSDLVTGHQIDPNRAMNEAQQGAIMGAGMGAGMHLATRPPKITAPKGPMIKGREYAQSVGKFSRDNLPRLSEETYQANQLKRAVKGKLAETATLESVDKSKTLSSRINHLQRQYETLSRTANHPAAPAKVKATAQKARERILEIHDRLKAEHEALHSKPKKKGKEPLEHVTDAGDLKALVGLVKEMRQQGNLKQADVAMGRFSRETKARVYDEVKRQEAHEKVKASQAQKDNKAINKADESNSKRTTKQLKGDIQTRTKEQTAEQKKAEGHKKTAHSLLGVLDELSQKPEPKTGTAIEHRASGKDEYAKMAQDAKTKPTKQKEEPKPTQNESPLKAFLKKARERSKKDLASQEDIEEEGIRLMKQGASGVIEFPAETGYLDGEKVSLPARKLYRVRGKGVVQVVLKTKPSDPPDHISMLYIDPAERGRGTLLGLLRKVKSDFPNIAIDADSLSPQMGDLLEKHADRLGVKLFSKENGRLIFSDSKPVVKQALQRKDFQSVHKMRETAREANKAGESIRIRYYAERTGETGEIEYKTLHDVKILEGKGGKETRWKGINEDGQMHHYIERNGTNSMHDSNIISVERTHEPVKYKLEVHPETGMAHPVDVETGEFIPQVYKPGVKSSEIHSKIDLLRKLDAGERVSPQDVMNVARQHEVMQMKEVSEKMSQAERRKSYEDTTGRPC